jgi:hypothetical protein
LACSSTRSSRAPPPPRRAPPRRPSSAAPTTSAASRQALASLALGARFFERPGDREARGGRGPAARDVARRILADPEPWAAHERWGRLHPALRGAISAMGAADATARPTMEAAMGLPFFTADLGAGAWRYAGAEDAGAADGGAGVPAGAPTPPRAPSAPLDGAAAAAAAAAAAGGGAGLPFMGGAACAGGCGPCEAPLERWGSGDLAGFVASLLGCGGEEEGGVTAVVSLKAGAAGVKGASGGAAPLRGAPGAVALRFRAWWRRLSRGDEARGAEEAPEEAVPQEQRPEQALLQEQQLPQEETEQQQQLPLAESGQQQQEEEEQQEQQRETPAAEVPAAAKRSLLQRAAHKVHKRCQEFGRRVAAQAARMAPPSAACGCAPSVRL